MGSEWTGSWQDRAALHGGATRGILPSPGEPVPMAGLPSSSGTLSHEQDRAPLKDPWAHSHPLQGWACEAWSRSGLGSLSRGPQVGEQTCMCAESKLRSGMELPLLKGAVVGGLPHGVGHWVTRSVGVKAETILWLLTGSWSWNPGAPGPPCVMTLTRHLPQRPSRVCCPAGEQRHESQSDPLAQVLGWEQPL